MKIKEALNIYIYARLEENKSELMLALSDFKDLKNKIAVEDVDFSNLIQIIQNFDVNICHLIKLINDEEILNEEVKVDWINAVLRSARDTFKRNNISGVNILNDSLPENFTYKYYQDNYEKLLDNYKANNIEPTFGNISRI